MATERGVTIHRGVTDPIELRATAADGEVLIKIEVTRRLYDPRMKARLERLLDREDPTLRIVSS